MSDKTYTIDELVDGLIRIADRIEWKQISWTPDKLIRGIHNGISIDIIDKLVMGWIYIHETYSNCGAASTVIQKTSTFVPLGNV